MLTVIRIWLLIIACTYYPHIAASDEFDPEEREAFVEDVYSAEDHIQTHHHHRHPQPLHQRQDYYQPYGGEGDEDSEDNEDQELIKQESLDEEDLIDKK